MPSENITEGILDGMKFGTAAVFPASHILFGITLQDWMYIFSIIASIFYIIDKLPNIIRRWYVWVKRKSGGRGSSTGLTDGESSL